MLSLLRDLIGHKASTDAALLNAIGKCPEAAADAELRVKLHHIVFTDRFWLSMLLGFPFNAEEERAVPDSFETLLVRFKDAHIRELAWISQATDADLLRPIGSGALNASQGIAQVCLHSMGHRSQCATRLRELGGTPPPPDLVVWLKNPTSPAWP